MVGSAAMRTEVVGADRIADSTAGVERLRRLLGILISSRNGLVDLEERVRMHQKRNQLTKKT